jgi:hypothetical protein
MTAQSYAMYCIIDSDRPIPQGIVGLEARAVWNLPYRDIGVVAGILTGPVRDVVAGAVEHETVVERLMQTHTVLPARFPTVFAGREAVLGMMACHYDRFRADLRRLNGCVEFGVRVIWPSVGKEPAAKVIPLHGSSGRSYMQERYRQHKSRQARGERADQFGGKLDAALSVFAKSKRLRSVAANSLAFDGAYLVEKDKQADFRRAFMDARSSEPDFKYLFSGPWPAYNFVTT